MFCVVKVLEVLFSVLCCDYLVREFRFSYYFYKALALWDHHQYTRSDLTCYLFLKVNVKVVPMFTSLCMLMLPPIASICDFTRYSPSPYCLDSREIVGRVQRLLSYFF
jgi:hypothetical protein